MIDEYCCEEISVSVRKLFFLLVNTFVQVRTRQVLFNACKRYKITIFIHNHPESEPNKMKEHE